MSIGILAQFAVAGAASLPALAGDFAAELPDEIRWAQARPMEASTLELGDYGPWAKPVVLYARSPEEWDRAVKRLLREGALWILPAPTAPEGVDWAQNGILLVALGRRSHPGYDLRIDDVRLLDDELRVHVHISVPSGLAKGKLNFPYHMVLTEKVDARKVTATYAYEVTPGPLTMAR